MLCCLNEIVLHARRSSHEAAVDGAYAEVDLAAVRLLLSVQGRDVLQPVGKGFWCSASLLFCVWCVSLAVLVKRLLLCAWVPSGPFSKQVEPSFCLCPDD